MDDKTQITNEVYSLRLDHYWDVNGERVKIGEPLVVNAIYNHNFMPRSICLNEMFERMQHEMLMRVGEQDD